MDNGYGKEIGQNWKEYRGIASGNFWTQRISKKTDKQILELKESQKKTDEQLRITIKKLDDVGRQLGDQGLVQGEVAEELFYRKE